MADIVAKTTQTKLVTKVTFGDQNQPQIAQTIINPSVNVYLQNLQDVNPTGLKDQSVVVYDSASGKFLLNQTKYDIVDGGFF